MKLGDYETHPIADAFPMLEGAHWQRFLDKVKRFGVLVLELWRYEGKILDGRNRYRAVLELGLKVKLKWRDFEGTFEEAAEFARAMNLEGRRNMSPSVCTLAACKLYQLLRPVGRGRRKKSGTGTELSRAEVAKRSGSSVSGMQDGEVVLEKCAPDVIKAIERDDLTISEALELAPLAHDAQLEALQRRDEQSTVRAKRAALRDSKPRNDEQPSPATALRQLLATAQRALEKLGATVVPHKDKDGLEIAYAGVVWSMDVQATGSVA